MAETRKKREKSKKAKGKLSEIERNLEKSRKQIEKLKKDIQNFDLNYNPNRIKKLRKSSRQRRQTQRYSPRF
tara:strand:+ start:5536 stop:5751 length:216 start_codon:yes stop_codon:yes gene_type:complete